MAAAPLWRRVVCAVLLPAALVRAARPSGKCGADALPTKVPSSIAISPPFERDLPVCYASEPHGLGALSGNWRTDDSPEPPYWNLSCPFEWAKYSCVHQGNAGHAARARMRFEPAGCAMLSVDGRQLARALRPNQRLMLIGDSHICSHGEPVLRRPAPAPAPLRRSHEPHRLSAARGGACQAQGSYSTHVNAKCHSRQQKFS